MAGKLNVVSNVRLGQVEVASQEPGIARWVTRILGCWHRNMSRPFSTDGKAYRVCVSCGARRPFNLTNWEMQGDFYYSRPTRITLRPSTQEIVSSLGGVKRPLRQYA